MTRGAQSGFTLLELLVGFTLLALLTVVLTAGLRSGMGTTDWVSARASATEDMVLVHRRLRELVETAVPIRDYDTQRPVVRFHGAPDKLELTGPAASGGTVRLARRTLLITPEGDLVLTEGRGAPRILARLPENARFAFYGPPERNAVARWRPRWTGHPLAPRLVRLEADGWPPAVAAFRLRRARR